MSVSVVNGKWNVAIVITPSQWRCFRLSHFEISQGISCTKSFVVRHDSETLNGFLISRWPALILNCIVVTITYNVITLRTTIEKKLLNFQYRSYFTIICLIHIRREKEFFNVTLTTWIYERTRADVGIRSLRFWFLYKHNSFIYSAVFYKRTRPLAISRSKYLKYFTKSILLQSTAKCVHGTGRNYFGHYSNQS